MSIKLTSFSNKKFIEEMVSAGDRVVCERDQTIYSKGTKAKNLYLLEQGTIDLNEDSVVRFSSSNPGEMFGWSSLVENGIYMNTAVSKTISSIIQIPREAVSDILDRYQDSALELYKHLGSHFSKQAVKPTE